MNDQDDLTEDPIADDQLMPDLPDYVLPSPQNPADVDLPGHRETTKQDDQSDQYLRPLLKRAEALTREDPVESMEAGSKCLTILTLDVARRNGVHVDPGAPLEDILRTLAVPEDLTGRLRVVELYRADLYGKDRVCSRTHCDDVQGGSGLRRSRDNCISLPSKVLRTA